MTDSFSFMQKYDPIMLIQDIPATHGFDRHSFTSA